MQDEQMDNMDDLIREASNSHHPAYDDKSWEKMEELLDKHLPVKKDRRKPFIFFLTLTFITGACFLAFLYLPSHKEAGIAPKAMVANIPAQIAASSHQSVGMRAENVPANSTGKGRGFSPANIKKFAQHNLRKPLYNSDPVDKGTVGKIDGSDGMTDVAGAENKISKNDQLLPEKNMQPTNGDKNSIPSPAGKINADQPVNTDIKVLKKDSVSANPKAIVKKDLPKITVPEPSSKSPLEPVVKKGFSNNFAINLSAGPDLSFVGLDNTSKAKLNYGAGLSYTFAGKFVIRSGFYIAKKTYSAMSTDYHPPASYWTNNSDLKSIYADCNIYEIPLNVSYNFKQSGNHNWFAGIGFSTFLMKRETYHYFYKDAWGQAMNKSWTLLNGGNQYFSVLNISGGYQYAISPNFSILVEPYLKLPLQGIGFGKIKLNSGGLLFTASIKPFAKRK